MKQIKLLALGVSLVGVTACTTTQGTDAVNALSYLFYGEGGQPARAQMLDATVEEALQYEFDRCISGQELTTEVQSECIKTAYATVKEDMNLEERRGADGRVIIERVDDEDTIYEESEEQESDN